MESKEVVPGRAHLNWRRRLAVLSLSLMTKLGGSAGPLSPFISYLISWFGFATPAKFASTPIVLCNEDFRMKATCSKATSRKICSSVWTIRFAHEHM